MRLQHQTNLSFIATFTTILTLSNGCNAFLTAFNPSSQFATGYSNIFTTQSITPTTRSSLQSQNLCNSGKKTKRIISSTKLQMGLDLVTYLRTEFISAALCTNQTPRSADVCLQLGTDDGRAIQFIPKTINTFITSTANDEKTVSVSVRRQLNQQRQRRGTDVEIIYTDQCADDLMETDDESVDVVISLQAAARMQECGMSWKKSVQEAARVLKPGGRLLFVEQSDLNDGNYLKYVQNLGTIVGGAAGETEEIGDNFDAGDGNTNASGEIVPVFSEVGMDEVDLVLVPHIAGVAIKSEEAGLSAQERKLKKKMEEDDRYAELSLSAFERGSKKRRKRKKQKDGEDENESSS